MSAADRPEVLRRVLADEPAWLVGGWVRDAELGRAATDVDMAVGGDPEELARRVARDEGGPVFALSEAFGAWRVLSRDRRFTFDFSPLQGSTIEEDLARRDFTVNAMAVPLGSDELVDPHGGRGDLETGTLRVLGERAYAEDPLRPLRLVRFAAELGFTPDAQTERLTTAAAPRLDEPSPERVYAELRRAVVAPHVLDALALGERLGVLAAVLPELTALEGIEQSRFHHLDVYNHTVEVLQRWLELEADLGATFGEHADAVRDVLDQPLGDDLTRGQAIRFGALFHDIAKPQTRGERPDGRPTFIGHDSQGRELVRDIFTRLRASERVRSFVADLTRHHLALGFLVHDRPLPARALHAYLRRCDPVEVEVTLLSCADRMATRGDGQDDWIAAHLELGREVMGPALAWRRDGPPALPLRGDELARDLGIEPGPDLGRLLAELEGAVFAGEVTDRAQAVDYARRMLDNR